MTTGRLLHRIGGATRMRTSARDMSPARVALMMRQYPTSGEKSGEMQAKHIYNKNHGLAACMPCTCTVATVPGTLEQFI